MRHSPKLHERIVKRNQPAPDWPTFDSELLRDVAGAFSKRLKAIGHKSVLDVSAEALVEMAEITLAWTCGPDLIAARRQLREIWARINPQND